MFIGKEFDMGFKNGTKPGAKNRKGHRWINNPNNAHKKVYEVRLYGRCDFLKRRKKGVRNEIKTSIRLV